MSAYAPRPSSTSLKTTQPDERRTGLIRRTQCDSRLMETNPQTYRTLEPHVPALDLSPSFGHLLLHRCHGDAMMLRKHAGPRKNSGTRANFPDIRLTRSAVGQRYIHAKCSQVVSNCKKKMRNKLTTTKKKKSKWDQKIH